MVVIQFRVSTSEKRNYFYKPFDILFITRLLELLLFCTGWEPPRQNNNSEQYGKFRIINENRRNNGGILLLLYTYGGHVIGE